jgi:hypothetical protein
MHLDRDENWQERKVRWNKVNALAQELVDVLGAAAGGGETDAADPDNATEDTGD